MKSNTASPGNDDSLSPHKVFPSLRLGRYRFVLEPRGPISLPAYQGSTWRGLIGNALLDVVCPWDRKDCAACRNSGACAYHYLYEAGLGEKAFANLPRPYIFFSTNKNGTEMSVEMTLIGQAGDFLPHLVAAWIRAGELGAGKGRGSFFLQKVYALQPKDELKVLYDGGWVIENSGEWTLPFTHYLMDTVPEPPWQVGIQTPLRLRQDGRNIGAIDWENAFKSLAIRLSLINQKYCGGTRLDKDSWQRVISFLARPGRAETRTKWFDWSRFSSTQHTHVPMGGVIGMHLITPPASLSTWWDWWQAASLFHLGKGTSMGLGKVSIRGQQHS